MKNFKQFLKENVNTENTVEQIKQKLLEEFEYDTWKEFIDNQEMGECRAIVHTIKSMNLENVEGYYGKLLIYNYNQDNLDYVDYDYDSNGNPIFMYHWVTINNKIYDFSKGTLKDYVEFFDLYGVEADPDIEYEVVQVTIM